MWGKRNKVISFRQACVSLSQVLWHSMDLTTSEHNHLQNELIRELERQEGNTFLISLYFLVALRNIMKYKEQGVLLTINYLIIHFFWRIVFMALVQKIQQIALLWYSSYAVSICYTGILWSWQFPTSAWHLASGYLPATGSREWSRDYDQAIQERFVCRVSVRENWLLQAWFLSRQPQT